MGSHPRLLGSSHFRMIFSCFPPASRAPGMKYYDTRLARAEIYLTFEDIPRGRHELRRFVNSSETPSAQ